MNFLQVQFDLIKVQNLSITEINELIPWERDLFMDQLREYINNENLRLKEIQMRAQRANR